MQVCAGVCAWAWGVCVFCLCVRVCARVRACAYSVCHARGGASHINRPRVRAGEDRKDQNLLTATGSLFRSVDETPSVSVRFRSIAITLDQACSLFIALVRIACPHGVLLGSRSPTLPGRCAHISVCRTRSQSHARVRACSVTDQRSGVRAC